MMTKVKTKVNTMMKMMPHSAGVCVLPNMILLLARIYMFSQKSQTLETNKRIWIATGWKHTFGLQVTNTLSLLKQYIVKSEHTTGQKYR